MSAIFYAEDLGIVYVDAEKIAGFMKLSASCGFVSDPNPWASHNKVRVYFTPWSQNRLPAYHLADKWFYDAHQNDVFADGFFYGTKQSRRLSELTRLDTGNFSGAKTKARLKEFAEVFYGEKANWD